MRAPRIETKRLILRGHRREDFEAYAHMWSRTVLGLRPGLKPLSREEAWGKFARGAGFWVLNGRGTWLAFDKVSGAFLGDVGASDFEREIVPPIGHMPEFSWVFDPDARGKGYATEAVTAVTEWADQNLSEPEFCCIIDRENTPSIALAERCGFAPTADTEYLGSVVTIFKRPRRGA